MISPKSRTLSYPSEIALSMDLWVCLFLSILPTTPAKLESVGDSHLNLSTGGGMITDG